MSLPAERVVRVLNQIIVWRGKPRQIRCDNDPEYISKLLVQGADKNQIKLVFIQPGNPPQNAYIERYNRTVRYNQYTQFTPKERLNLTFAALSRGDEAEADRLWQTCPRQ